MRRIAKLLCLSSLLLFPAAPSWAESLETAPLNPAFVNYYQQISETKASSQSANPTGRTPSPWTCRTWRGSPSSPTRA